MTPAKNYTLSVAIMLVIANMIGTGVFTSLGYQVGPLPSGFVILMLWLLGGVVALSGAFTYAEIATVLKKSGGEYLYLGKIFHPAVGFLSGWMSAIVGFAGAISAVAIAIGEYASETVGISTKVIAISTIIIVSAVHWFGVKTGGRVQTLLTAVKLLLILFFCIAPFFILSGNTTDIQFAPQPGDWDLILSPGFAVSLVFVVYAYTGWNASAYIAGNLDNPSRNLPMSLIAGTVVVVIIYLTLNAMFLYTATFQELQGQNDIGNVAAYKLLGPEVGAVFSGIFSFALLSTLSAMTIAGPRVTEAMGEDYLLLKSFSLKNRYDMPYLAILVQAGWSIFLVMVSSFKEIIQYISVSLSIFSMITVIGVFFLRRKKITTDHFKTPLYPLPPIIFIVCTSWMIYYVAADDFKIILYSLGTMAPGLLLYFFAHKHNQKNNITPMKISFFAFLIAFGMFASCTSSQKTEQVSEIDSVATDTVSEEVITEEIAPVIVKDTVLDNLARFIAGLPQSDSSSFSTLENDHYWKEYRTSMDNNWKKMYDSRLSKIKDWEANTLSALQNDSLTLFYPFSGPDFLHANYLYPHASTYILAALEPVKPLPALDTITLQERDMFLDSLGNSLRDIFQKSYFITRHMQEDLKRIRGVLPPLYFFIERSGHELLDQTFITIDSLGKETEVSGNKLHWQKTPGVKLVFRNNETGAVKTLYYFSVSISNGGLQERPEFIKFVTSHAPFNTFVKSASYLMHYTHFTQIKQLVLDNAENLFQDDTGIPYKDFRNHPDFTIQFYGEYVKPVKDFGDARYQADLDSAFKSSTTRQNLPFSLGYHWGSAKQHYILVRKQRLRAGL